MTVFLVQYTLKFVDITEAVDVESNMLYADEDALAVINELFGMTANQVIADPRDGQRRLVELFKLKSVSPVCHVDMLSSSVVQSITEASTPEPGDIRSRTSGV